MTTTTPTQHTAVADAFVATVPSASLLRAVPLDPAAVAALVGPDGAIVTSFVGAVSADTALMFDDLSQLTAAAGTLSPSVSVLDVLRPALEAATAVLGTGVLGESRVEAVDTLLLDPATTVFELVGPARTVRMREDGTVAGLGTAQEASDAAPVLVPSAGNLGRINAVEMALTVEIGRTRMSVRDVLGLEPGAVVELDRSAGAPADVLLNGRVIAHGEVVVVDQDYAVRITKILDVADGI
jgi:flagellar motor switch protein FliN/FliY